jgi:hypothetical protein
MQFFPVLAEKPLATQWLFSVVILEDPRFATECVLVIYSLFPKESPRTESQSTCFTFNADPIIPRTRFLHSAERLRGGVVV